MQGWLSGRHRKSWSTRFCAHFNPAIEAISGLTKLFAVECRSDLGPGLLNWLLVLFWSKASFSPSIHRQSFVCFIQQAAYSLLHSPFIIFFCSPSQNENTFSLTAWTMALACFISRSLINIYYERLKIIALLSSVRLGTRPRALYLELI